MRRTISGANNSYSTAAAARQQQQQQQQAEEAELLSPDGNLSNEEDEGGEWPIEFDDANNDVDVECEEEEEEEEEEEGEYMNSEDEHASGNEETWYLAMSKRGWSPLIPTTKNFV